MQFRRLGKTELMVSVLGYGALGLDGVTPENIRIAVEGGMNYIDSARIYTGSEVKIGKALTILDCRDKLILSSKSMARTLDQFKVDFETTLNNLGTDYLDILFLHDVSTEKAWSMVMSNGHIEYMNELKSLGRIRHIGCSTHEETIGLKIIESGLFEVVMLAYNAANPELASTLIPLANKHDMGIVIMKPLGGGVLTSQRSRQLGFEMNADEALRFVVSNPDISTTIVGMDSEEYVKEALAVGNSDIITMTAKEREDILNKVNIKGKNYCRGCGYCLPCPQSIPIRDILRLYNRWEVFNQVDWAQMHQIRKEFAEKIPFAYGPEKCIGCNSCTQRCPYNLPISELMKKATEIK